MRKRNKFEQELIDSVNQALRANKVRSESDSLFVWAQSYLLSHNKYEGFNYYCDRSVGDTTVRCLTCSCTNYEYLQLW